MFGVSRQTLERLRKEYPSGTRVELIRLDDPYRKIPSGTIGTVEFVDDAVEDSRLALACMSAAYFGHPAKKLKTIGITGTKGKTTTTYMVRSILESAGIKTGLIGTIESIVGSERIPSANTTPESYRVQELFAKMVDAGLDAVVMEVSSQALMLHRVSGFVFDIGVFTNLEPDHIGENEHKDFADYMHCKSLLFQQCRHGIFNGDSEHLQGILQGHTCTVETFGYGAENDLIAQKVELKKEHGALGVKYHVGGSMDFDVEVNVPGKFSVYNSLTAIAICHHFGVSVEEIKKAMLHVSVKGRIEIVPVTKRYTLMIDYAHNAMALESLLTTLKEYEPGRLVCLFGCGGNRAKSRRYEMVAAMPQEYRCHLNANPKTSPSNRYFSVDFPVVLFPTA